MAGAEERGHAVDGLLRFQVPDRGHQCVGAIGGDLAILAELALDLSRSRRVSGMAAEPRMGRPAEYPQDQSSV
jgi:hypothetical protein